jgi:polygalacturonase
MDVDCCRNVRISNCYVNSPWDDGICLKADHALGSSKQTEFVTITNCYVSGCWEEGTLLDGTYKKFAPDVRGVSHTGRIKFGTESDGGFRNITISNCVFEGCQGLALETVDGALLEDITVTNISMRDIMSAPIFLRLGRRMLRLGSRIGFDYRGHSGPLHRRRQNQQRPGAAPGRRNERSRGFPAPGTRGLLS